jgi:hypothetical protein
MKKLLLTGCAVLALAGTAHADVFLSASPAGRCILAKTLLPMNKQQVQLYAAILARPYAGQSERWHYDKAVWELGNTIAAISRYCEDQS